ncbi:MAG TPA: DUF3015 family protein [Polyangiaceae bacterium]|nr:DUF3015 family protein [Polyangiaceae bacterium]
MRTLQVRWSVLICGLLLASSGFAQDEESKEGETAEEAAEPAAEGAAAEGEAKVSDDELVKGMKTNTGRGYGPAGCGLGSLIFEPNSGFTQIFAATTNGTFGSQTFGISSGTSNCSDTAGGSASAKSFVETNRTALAKDIARGQGETIESLSRLGGCASSHAVGASLQKNFDKVFPSAAMSDSEVGNSVVDALRSDATLACHSLI